MLAWPRAIEMVYFGKEGFSPGVAGTITGVVSLFTTRSAMDFTGIFSRLS